MPAEENAPGEARAGARKQGERVPGERKERRDRAQVHPQPERDAPTQDRARAERLDGVPAAPPPLLLLCRSWR